MTELTRLVDTAGANSLSYIDPAFPESPDGIARRAASRIRSPDAGCVCPSGVNRNGRDYRNYWLELVDEVGILNLRRIPRGVVPEYLWYHFGNLHLKTARPTRVKPGPLGSTRGYSNSCAQSVTTRQGYGLFGHSAGGQFVHRMLSLGFRDRVVIAISANAGTYAMPDLATPWPFGLGETDVYAEALRALLAFPITVMAGTEDVLTTGRFFPRGPRSMRQGANR